MNTELNVAVAFGAGLLSFLSPCVLPLVPGYLSFVSGVNVAGSRADGGAAVAASRGTVVANSGMFVLGFSVVFVLLGATATALGSQLNQHLPLLGQIAGIVLILFGLHMTGLIPIKALYREKRFQVSEKPLGLFGAFVVGCAFAFGWTPCIGPVLGGILTMAAEQKELSTGIWLLLAYSLGLGVPFMLTALAINQFYRFFDAMKAHFRKVEIVSGLLLMAVGALIFSNKLSVLAGYFPFLDRFAI